MCRQWLKDRPLIPLEADTGLLLGRPVQPDIRRRLQPLQPLLIEIAVAEEFTSVDEVAADIRDGPLDFAFRLRARRTTGANAKVPMRRKPQEFRILQQLPALH